MPVRYEKGGDGIVTLTFDAPGAPVNTMTEAWQKAFAAAVERLQKEKDSIAGVILCLGEEDLLRRRGAEGHAQVRPERRRRRCSAGSRR